MRRTRGTTSRGCMRAQLAVSVVVAFTACRSATSGDGAPAVTSAVAYGTVTRSDGTPLAGWTVTGLGYRGVCQGPRGGRAGEEAADPQPTRTGPSGQYRLPFTGIFAPFDGCVVVTAAPADLPDSVAATASGNVRFSLASSRDGPPPPLDSVVVDLRVP